MEQQALPADVKKCGYLRKQKSSRRRFFVLRCASTLGPARLEYYESEKKFRAAVGGGGGLPPRRSVPLEGALAVNKRADARHRFLLVLYGRDGSFGVAAEGEEEQQEWHAAFQELLCGGKAPAENGQYGITTPGPAFKDVWQVSLRPKGLGQAKNLVGVYRLCLTAKTINFIKLNSEVPAVVLQLMNVRRCGHSENYFFIEVGRSAVTGPGEFWMQVEDSVVAQNMHETVLESMKALSEEFRLRSKSQSLASNPISVPPRRHHSNPPPSQVGFSRKSRVPPEASNSSPALKHDSQKVNLATEENDGSRLASEEGSPANFTPTLCTKSLKGNEGIKLHLPLSHIRSTPVPSASLTSLSSPVRTNSLAPDCIYTQTSNFSVSESPNDYSFISSDECGSSPSDYSKASYDQLSHLPSSLEDSNLNYITMAIRGSLSQEGQCHRRLPKWTSGRDGKRERNLNKRASLGKVTLNMPQRQDSEEYTMMVRTPSRESFTTPAKLVSSDLDTVDVSHGEAQQETGKIDLTDNGYMAMLPGILPVSQGKSDDYMPMTPNSVSPPRHIEGTRSEISGYMLMSPNGSCSPDIIAYRRSWAHGDKFSLGSNDSKMSGSDYMNMSPLSHSASSTPPDTSPHLADDAPKLGYSYYSLPRSHKHTSEMNICPSNPSTSSSSQLSCSSSTSSDSLDDPDHHHHNSQTQHYLTQQNGNSVPKHGKACRPVSLFIDVSKASTLPKVRENPLPPEPKSPGEYVSIAFKAAVSRRPLPRPVSCIGGFQDLPAVARPSEYMNMDLGLSSSCSQICVKAFVDSEPQRKPYVAMTEKCLYTGDSEPSVTLINSPTLSDYTEMAFIAGADTPKTSSPKESETNMIEHLGPLSAKRLSPNSSQGPKLIRVDPQSRRRHCSETFLSVPVGTAVLSLPYADHAKRHSSASFENVWSKAELGAMPTTANERLENNPRYVHTALDHGLNYIDLDLTKDSFQEGPPTQSRVQLHSGNCGVAGLNSYASIDFNKSEELRSQKSSKDGTEC